MTDFATHLEIATHLWPVFVPLTTFGFKIEPATRFLPFSTLFAYFFLVIKQGLESIFWKIFEPLPIGIIFISKLRITKKGEVPSRRALIHTARTTVVTIDDGELR